MNGSNKAWPLCGKCGKAKTRLKSGRYYCTPCHSLAVRTKYKDSRNRARANWAKRHPEKYREWRTSRALRLFGVTSNTTGISRLSASKAYNARERWNATDETILMSGEYTEPQLVLLLGRTIRSIQRKKWALRQEPS